MSDPTVLTKDEEEFHEQVSKELRQSLLDDPLLLIKPVLSENETLKDLAASNHQKFIVTFISLLFAMGVAFVALNKETQFRYFFINSKGHVYETKGMTYPTANIETITNFATEVATAFHTFTYRNYKANFTRLQDKCDAKLVESYYNTLGNGKVFSVAEQFNQHYDSVASGATIVQQRVIDADGRLEWRVNLSVNERITGSMAPVEHDYDVVIDIRQVPLSESFTGLKCVRFDENYKGR